MSDPISYECTCPARTNRDGVVLLFYRYFSAPPALETWRYLDRGRLEELATFHREAGERYGLRGKLRIAAEGFNITVGGTKDGINSYTRDCVEHWSFAGLALDTQTEQDAFFKPSAGGCACVFDSLNVRITAEITPLGITNYLPQRWDLVQSLPPREFHDMCWQSGDKLLLDVRNHYESRVGYFIDPITGVKAVTPQVRRFSQFPLYVKTHMTNLPSPTSDQRKGRNILTYCTGGIRCEKAVRWMAEEMQTDERDRVCTLQGGIAAYLTWIDAEIKAGRKTAADSLFRGKNYVFDARGTVALDSCDEIEPVSSCHVCERPSDRLDKCQSGRCQLLLVVCAQCANMEDLRCCPSCKAMDDDQHSSSNDPSIKRRTMCVCEEQREQSLWRNRPDRVVSSKPKKTKSKTLPSMSGRLDRIRASGSHLDLEL